MKALTARDSQPNGEQWLQVRRDGKFLFEYDPGNGRIRLRRWGRIFIVELSRIDDGRNEAAMMAEMGHLK
jgi:hypothetical protein